MPKYLKEPIKPVLELIELPTYKTKSGLAVELIELTPSHQSRIRLLQQCIDRENELGYTPESMPFIGDVCSTARIYDLLGTILQQAIQGSVTDYVALSRQLFGQGEANELHQAMQAITTMQHSSTFKIVTSEELQSELNRATAAENQRLQVEYDTAMQEYKRQLVEYTIDQKKVAIFELEAKKAAIELAEILEETKCN